MVVNNKMRVVRYCKDKMGTVSVAHVVYIELGYDEPMDTSPVVVGDKLVADGTPCIVYGPNAREQAASLPERQPMQATWQKTDIAMDSTRETNMVSKKGMNSHAVVCILCCRSLRNPFCISHTWF